MLGVASTPGVRYWLADTGCPVDLAGRKSLPKLIADHVRKSEEPRDFDTANGALPADEQAVMQVEGLPTGADPYVLEESPDVLTVGRR